MVSEGPIYAFGGKLCRLKVGNFHAHAHTSIRGDRRECASMCLQLLAIFYSRPPLPRHQRLHCRQPALITIYVNIFSAPLLAFFLLPQTVHVCVCEYWWFLVEIFNYPPLTVTPVATTTTATPTLATAKLLIPLHKRVFSAAVGAVRWLGACF